MITPTLHIYTIDEIRQMVLPIIRKYRAEKAILFGSYARQEANANSDIDLMLVGGNDFDPTDVFAVADELHHLAAKPVDVYEIQEINPNSDFLDNINREGVVIQ